jgi:signal transduction histidine kinase
MVMSDRFEQIVSILASIDYAQDIHKGIATALPMTAQAVSADDGAYLRYKNQRLHFHTGMQDMYSPRFMDVAQLLLATGDTLFVSDNGSVLALRLLGGGKTLGVLVFNKSSGFDDVEVKLATLVSEHLALRIYNARLQYAERNYRKFVMNFSQELRSPLTPLKGYATLMLMGGAGAVSEMQSVFLRNIRDSADRMMLMVNGVLNLSRFDAGEKMQFNSALVNVTNLLDEVIQLCLNRPYHASKNLDVKWDTADGLPLIRGDKEKLLQVLNNVIDNACDYSRPGGRIDIYAEPVDASSHVLIKVTDHGVGISPDHQEAVWKRFWRNEEDVVNLNVVGTGLGLPMARELVRLHQGEIWFESERGKGTTFYIKLPVKQG